MMDVVRRMMEWGAGMSRRGWRPQPRCTRARHTAASPHPRITRQTIAYQQLLAAIVLHRHPHPATPLCSAPTRKARLLCEPIIVWPQRV